jgi:hypothetical protein
MPYTRSQANQAKRQRTASVAKRIPTALLTNILEMKHEMEVAEWREEHKRRFASNYIDIKAGLEREAEPEQVVTRHMATLERLVVEIRAMCTRVAAQAKDVRMAMTVATRNKSADRVSQHQLAVMNQLNAELQRLNGMCHQLRTVMGRWVSERRTVSRVAALL